MLTASGCACDVFDAVLEAEQPAAHGIPTHAKPRNIARNICHLLECTQGSLSSLAAVKSSPVIVLGLSAANSVSPPPVLSWSDGPWSLNAVLNESPPWLSLPVSAVWTNGAAVWGSGT